MDQTTINAKRLGKQLAKEISPRADDADVKGMMPTEDAEALKASGYLNLSLPKTYGGEGLSLHDCLIAHLELAQGSGATAMVAGMPMQIFGHARETHPWSEEMFEKFCRKISLRYSVALQIR